ncbi:MAG: nodulation protein NfeD [Desulfobacterales bacterium]
MKTAALIIVLFTLFVPGSPNIDSARCAAGDIYTLKVNAAIGPGVADYITSGIATANEQEAAILIIELDTPGGLAESMRVIDKAILASRVPIAVYVSPSGARAASAGVMITMAADIAAMAPGTNIGAAHPVGGGGQEINKTMSEKVVNDMVAQARSIAEKRGRNAAWVEKAIRESVSATETEALKKNVIDLIAKDTDELIRKLDGREIKDKGRLKLADAGKVVLTENLRDRILRTISDPNIAYILLMVGLAGLYFELSHPGAIFPGVIGGISIILAFFALQALPINTAGILLILLSIVFFVLEMKIASYGLLSIAGIVTMVLGSLMLFKSSSPEMRISLTVLVTTVLLVSGFFAVVAGLVFRAQVSQPRTGANGMIGKIGVVRLPLTPDGKVFVHGELWQATAGVPVAEGARVRVVGIENLLLTVEPVEPGENTGGSPSA